MSLHCMARSQNTRQASCQARGLRVAITVGRCGLSPVHLARRFFRVGSMVLLCHDISDILMEAAKLCKYAGLETASTALFVAFMVTWLLARLTYYPFWIIHSTLCALQQPLKRNPHPDQNRDLTAPAQI